MKPANLGAVSTELLNRAPRAALPERFQWRSKTGAFHFIDEMESNHLFNVLQHIWNHVMPPVLRTTTMNARRKFGNFYTPDYMRRAVMAIIPELMDRTDLQPFQVERVLFMRETCMKAISLSETND